MSCHSVSSPREPHPVPRRSSEPCWQPSDTSCKGKFRSRKQFFTHEYQNVSTITYLICTRARTKLISDSGSWGNGEKVVSKDHGKELTVEQRYFDAARKAYDEERKWDDPRMWGVGTGPDRRAMKKHQDSKERLNDGDAVSIGRMDMEDGETYYIGKTSISDDLDKLVFNWKSPIAKKYYQASTHDRHGVARKRSFKTTRNHVDTFNDRIFAELEKLIKSLDEEISSDDVLLNSLATARTGQMQDIVRTIQASQDRLMREHKDQLLVIQGGPGTGKTAVALHRASWLLYTFPDDLPADDLLVVGPNPAFTKYIQQVLRELGDERVRQTSLQELLAGGQLIKSVEPDSVAKIKGRAEMADVIAVGLDDRIHLPSSALRIGMRNSALTVTIFPETFTEDIARLRSEPYGIGRQLLKERVMEAFALEANLRTGISAADIVDSTSLESSVDRMWPRLSAAQFVRELLGSKQRLRQAGVNYLSTDDIELLHRGAADRIADEQWTLADLALIDEAESHMSDKHTLWGHIVVDEAQDLTPMQLFGLRRRSRTGSMTIVGDVAQSTGPFARESWDDVVSALRSRLPINIQELKHGYRVPKEVFDVASHVLQLAAPGLKAPTIVRSANAEPELFEVVGNQLPREVAKIAKHHASKGRFVGVIAPRQRWEEIQLAFTDAKMVWKDSSAGQLGESINLVTPQDSKGLEFDAVVVVDPRAILDDDNGARLLYIAITRTTSRLDILGTAGGIPDILRNAFSSVTLIDDPTLDANTIEEDPQLSRGATTSSAPKTSSVAAAFQKSMVPAIKVGPHEPETEISPPLQSSWPWTPKNSSVVANGSTVEKLGQIAREVTTDAEPAQHAVFTAIELELIAQNAQFLTQIIQKMYGPELQRAILREVIQLVEKE